MTMDFRLVQFSNEDTPSWASVEFVSAEMSESRVQFLKALELIVESPSGIPDRFTSEVHPSKQFGPKVHILVPDMFRRFVHAV